MSKTKQTWIESLLVYKDIRMLRILLLGAISGFPWVLIATSLTLWLQEEGLKKSTIGWAGLIFAVYAFNYLWAPIIDRIRIPFLTNKIGHRRAWIVLMQVAILFCLFVWSFINPSQNLALLIGVGLIIAIASATQDITVDALRIEQINPNEGKSMAAGAAMAVIGWWTGYKLGGAIALFTASYFENQGIIDYWQQTFLILGLIVILMNIGLMFVHEIKNNNKKKSYIKNDKVVEKNIVSTSKKNNLFIIGLILFIFIESYILAKIVGSSFFQFIPNTLFFNILLFVLGFIGFAIVTAQSQFGRKISSWVGSTIGGPFFSFFNQNAITEKNIKSSRDIISIIWIFIKKYRIGFYILGFIFLFKIGEAFLGRMSVVFYKEIGFSKGDIAIYSKTFGWITTVVFTFLGGLFSMRSGSVKTLFFAGILMATTNLLFSFLDWYVGTIPLINYYFDFSTIFLKTENWILETSNHQLIFGLAVILDDITAAFATVAFVAFISLLVNRNYTATQYALLASVGTAGRTLLASSSGALVEWLNDDWSMFFFITSAMVIPSLIFLWFIRKKINLGGK